MSRNGLAAMTLAMAVLTVVPARGEEYRKWTSAKGKFAVEAKLVELTEDADGVIVVVIANEEGKQTRVPLEKLSARDQGYVEGRQASRAGLADIGRKPDGELPPSEDMPSTDDWKIVSASARAAIKKYERAERDRIEKNGKRLDRNQEELAQALKRAVKAANRTGNKDDAARIRDAIADLSAGYVGAENGPALPQLVFGKWFPLLSSPDHLTGWDRSNDRIRYSDGILETRENKSVKYAIVVRDVGVRAKVKKEASGGNTTLTLRANDKGNYSAWNHGRNFGIGKVVGNNWVDLTSDQTPNALGDFFEFKFVAVGETLTVSVNGEPLLQARDTTHTAGAVAVGGMGDSLFKDVAVFIPEKESLIADNRKAIEKKGGSVARRKPSRQ